MKQADRAARRPDALLLAGRLVLVVAGLGVTAFAAPTPAAAQGRCSDLWSERNAIYARNGYCFNTERGRAAFGRGCFPPYGRLSGWEKRRVAEIQDEEHDLGCR